MKRKALLLSVFLLFGISSVSFADTAYAYLHGVGYDRDYSNSYTLAQGVTITYNFSMYISIGSGTASGRAFISSLEACSHSPGYVDQLYKEVSGQYSFSNTIIATDHSYWVEAVAKSTGSTNTLHVSATMNW